MPLTSPSPSRQRILLLTLDAFNTIYHPRVPIPDAYIHAARARNLPRAQLLTPTSLGKAFKSIFKAQTKAYPNYGRELAIRGEYGGARQWWEEIVRGTFRIALSDGFAESGGTGTSAGTVNANANAHTNGKTNLDTTAVQIPEDLVQGLLKMFASRDGYALYPGAESLFEYLRRVKRQGTASGPFDRVVVGVLSNSDDRVPAVLRSLGLRVGKVRADEDIESTRLPGFEERGGGIDGGLREEESSGQQDVDFVVTSYEAGVEKPHRKIFDIARRQAERLVGCGQEDLDWTMVHVGDDLEKDYRGCLQAGWRGYLGLEGRSPDELEGVRAVDMLEGLEDLEGKLEGFEE
ncbi:hypothetical protein P170DRAFT_439508 [Aspergillus steynii IBT 23096]|uniref:Haloacid dehalogenase-like hydrolase n=1 Tax=Aspergillus steynii IBT 23096 TaxID=1392250 RepID=A0A2I2FYT6_9EURO|nr:uncharacterized protein P170DRAFT_439508 [Aspergillus steynii IBT 23096]PLB45787.1 hypothetical protein P170DRAFT_439508 [Aspergillus steynii IBT 23096]